MRVLITGGGTGGHLYPALAVAGLLRERDPGGEILFVGTGDGLEATAVPARGFAFRPVAAARWPRRLSLQALAFAPSLLRGYRQSLVVVREWRPQAVFATGGYVSVPLGLAAARLSVPLFIHEQNAVPGLANRLLSRWASTVFLTFPSRDGKLYRRARIIHSGLPIRREILSASRAEGLAYFGLDPGLSTVLVMGGSKGAQRINEVMLEVYGRLAAGKQRLPERQVPEQRLPEHRPLEHQAPERHTERRAPEQRSAGARPPEHRALQFVHLTGTTGYDGFCKQMADKGINEDKVGKIVIRPYLEEMEYGLAAADLMICRAGAATIAELTALGIPAILIPYPYAAGDHQLHNALYLADKQAAVVIPEPALTPEILLEQVQRLLGDDARRRAMSLAARRFGRPQAGEIIAQAILKAGRAGR